MIKRLSVIGILSLLLISCGSDDELNGTATDTTTDDSGGSTSTDTGIRIGSGTGSSFTEGALDVASTTQLSAGGSTSVTATLVTSTLAPYTTATDVTFTSDCVAQGLAMLGGPIASRNGTATSTYTAMGCSGVDTITATATVGGQILSATGTVSVAPAELGAIQFVSASPTTIALKGTGGAGLQDTSIVTFKVTNETGGPVVEQRVDFSLSTEVGGISLIPATGETGFDGKVATIVQSGTVATPLRIIAVARGTAIQTQSDQLTVTTGIPVAEGLSLSVDNYNPEGLNFDGETVAVAANVMDRFSNPVPDGTIVNFRAEAGRVDGSCATVSGACSVTWTSQSQHLATGDVNEGLATIMAYAIGEERFNDENGDGRFNDGAIDDTYSDIGEVFLDKNFDNVRDFGEPYIDFDGNGAFDSVGDSLFNGVLCEFPDFCSSTTSVIVSDDLRIILSGSRAIIEFFVDDTLAVSKASLSVRGGVRDSMGIHVTDVNGNIMPSGSTISVIAPLGVEVNGSTSLTVVNTVGLNGTVFELGLADADVATVNRDGEGYVEIKVTTPNGLETTASIPITY